MNPLIIGKGLTIRNKGSLQLLSPQVSLAATALMVTHNMEHALRYGNRLLIMHEGKIIVDLNREQRSDITLNDLLTAFERASQGEDSIPARVSKLHFIVPFT